MSDRPTYPNVRCVVSGHPDEPGYIVCCHVENGKAVQHVRVATPQQVGLILCRSHYHWDYQMHLVCATCARESGWLYKLEDHLTDGRRNNRHRSVRSHRVI